MENNNIDVIYAISLSSKIVFNTKTCLVYFGARCRLFTNYLEDETIVTFLSTTCVEDFISNKNEIPLYGNSIAIFCVFKNRF